MAIVSRLKTARLFSTSAATNGGNGSNGNGNNTGKKLWDFLIPSVGGATLFKLVFDKLVKQTSYDFQKAKAEFNISPDGVMKWEVPAAGLEPKDIKNMLIDLDNIFVYEGETSDGFSRSASLKLPPDANFEKATLKARMEKGMIHVTAIGFQKEVVPITFID